MRLEEAGHAQAALDDSALANQVAEHKTRFFREKDKDGVRIDYAAAVSGKLTLVPKGEALKRLEADYQKMAQSLRAAGIRAEMYLGTAGMKAQMKYADKRGAPCVVIQGGDERARGEVQIKDLIEGAKASANIKDSKEWRGPAWCNSTASIRRSIPGA